MTVPQSQLTGERLDSWKEIAEYLRRDLRTVRRWERTRNLPIHRVPGGGRSAVYAFRKEIDAWLSDMSVVRDVVSQEDNPSDPNGTNEDVLLMPPSYSSRSQRFASRLRFARVAGAIAFLAILSMPFVLRQKQWVHSATASPEAPPKIISVSPILPQQDQTIMIRGSGLGLHTAYKNVDSPFIAVRDKTARWSAGRIIPQNWDEVTLNVKSWQDDEIVISGFSGAYGSGNWKLALGDEIEIAVWNPQSGVGPAVYNLIVSPLQ